MSSSDDDVPLGRRNGIRISNSKPAKSAEKIPKSVDKAMKSSNSHPNKIEPGISVRYGPVDEMDVDGAVEGSAVANGKRKSRSSIGNAKSYKEPSSESEDDMPLTKRRRTKSNAVDSDSDDAPLVTRVNGHVERSKKPVSMNKTAIGELTEDSDVPLGTKLKEQKAKIERRAEKEEKAIKSREKKSTEKSPAAKPKKKKNEDSDDEPIARKKSQVNGVKAPSKKPTKVKKEDSDDDVPLRNSASKKKSTAKATPIPTSSKKNSKKAAKQETEQDEEADAEEEEYKWWEAPQKGDGTIKWSTLEHNGVVFPPPYEALPKNAKLKYDGVPIKLALEAEEVAGFFGSMLNSTHNVENLTFQRNFFNDFKKILKETGGATDKQGNKVDIKEFDKCDFKPIFEYYDAEREKKKALSTAEKKAIKAQKDEVEAPYMHCMWDGRKQKVGNFRVEPPGLFRGRGEHPKTGMVKQRVDPEQITINIGKGAPVPKAPKGHKWKEVKHDQEGTWLAMWQENINGNYKYVMLAANSDIKGKSDYNKFEKARELKKHIATIRNDYRKEMKSEIMAERQRATAVYLIDEFALRAGNEKSDDEAETVGCCSLKFENVTLKPPNKVIFDFLGKDSIRFYDEVDVDEQVFKNLRIFKKNKTDGDEIFDRLTTSGLNKHLGSYMQGLTAKVFRTYNASYTMSNLLKDMKSKGTILEKVKDYNDANRRVAILCNHKRTVTAGHAGQMEKMEEKIKGLMYQKWRLKQMLLDVDPKQKKKRGADYFALDDDLDQEWVKEHQNYLVEEQRQKIEKKFAKENEKLVADGQKAMKDKELKERLQAANELAAKFKKENKSGKVEAEGKGPSVEKIDGNIDKMDQRVSNMRLQAEDKESNKEVALGTSKINYIDPRLTVVFSKKFNVPIEKFFSKTLREKFDWAIKSVDENWEF